jgi:PAS domain S-box-containing protein
MPWYKSKLPLVYDWQHLLYCLVLALAYVITGRLGLLLAVPPGYASAIFPPAGIAIGAALVGGRHTLPWIFVGSCLLNLWVGYAVQQESAWLVITLALWIAAASVSQAAVGAWLLRHLINYPMALDSVRDVARFLLVSPLLCVTSATVSLGGMAVLGVISISQIGPNWFAWWIGDTLGVLLFLPLLMVLVGEPRTLWRSRAKSVALPMLLFFAIFVAIFVRTRAWERAQSLAEFQFLSRDLSDKLQSQMAAQEDFLQQLSVFLSGPLGVTRADFSALTSRILQRFPAIEAVEWAPRVAGADREGFEAEQRRAFGNFVIGQWDSHARLLPAGDRAVFYPVTYVEPLQGNEATVGLDLASDPVRSAAIEETIHSHAVVATAAVRLGPENPLQGQLLVLAVPNGANGPGVLSVVLRMDKILKALVGPAAPTIAVTLIDQQANQPLLDNFRARVGVPRHEQLITFGTRTYYVRTEPTELYLTRHQSWQSWAVLVIGVLSTSLLGGLLMLSTGERQRFAELLSERTRERDRIWQVSEDLLGVGNFDGYFPIVNPAWTKTLGWSEQEIRALHVDELRHPEDALIGIEGRRRLAEGAGTVRMENRFRHKNGSYRWIDWTMTAEQGLIYMIGRDVTADKEAARLHRETEDQLRQLQKMDSVGQLTGGIAHDFNNLLTIIIGNLEILNRMLETASDKAKKAVRAAMSGATRAATLTQRLLSYAQRQPLRPRAVNLNELVAGMDELIRRTQGEIISYEFALGDGVPFCFCDTNQLETALLNLVINARDAMPNGGRLRIETANVVFDQPSAHARGITAGAYAMLAVSDTGVGMSPETAKRAFEPFFTTKDTGKGTGLGLSMVYGFIKQSNGHIEIDSEPNRGTTLRIFLPALADHDVPDTRRTKGQQVAGDRPDASETILVTEDDPDVRGFVMGALRDVNYQVIEAGDGATALAIIARSDERIDLLLTDVVMPGMNGDELAHRARRLMPNIKVLFMTGYSRNAFIHEGRLSPDIELIEKPFRSEDLAAKVRAVLDAQIDRSNATPGETVAASG